MSPKFSKFWLVVSFLSLIAVPILIVLASRITVGLWSFIGLLLWLTQLISTGLVAQRIRFKYSCPHDAIFEFMHDDIDGNKLRQEIIAADSPIEKNEAIQKFGEACFLRGARHAVIRMTDAQ